MKLRRLGPFEVSAIGLGCMNLSHAYGTPPSREQALSVLDAALDGGITLLDTAALYGFGANETLLGSWLTPFRHRVVLATKCGMHGVDGRRVIDGRPDTLRASCEASLQRLRTDVIDLLYLHRLDPKVPIEDSIGALADLVRSGKVRTLGLSEVSAATLRRAHAIHPIAAVQSEYSLWTRNPEIAVLQACHALGAAFVAFSPLARGFLAGARDDATTLPPQDIRRAMPRFQPDHHARNLPLQAGFEAEARQLDIPPARLALAWLLHRAGHVIALPGTTQVPHLREWLGADTQILAPSLLSTLDERINERTVAGPRYNAATQAEIDTEEF